MDDLRDGWTRLNEAPEPWVEDMPGFDGEPDMPGVYVRTLNLNVDDRGSLIELFRGSWSFRLRGNDRWPKSEPDDGVNQVYVSETDRGVIKGWHLHRVQTDRFVCLAGRLRLVLCDLRPLSRTQHQYREFTLDARAPKLVLVPPMVAHGWISFRDGSKILNAVTHEYDGTDEYRLDPSVAPATGLPPYDWRKVVDG